MATTVRQCMLSTRRNPYNPFDDFKNWYVWDTTFGLNCCAYLDRVAAFSDSLSDYENELEQERAIDEIIKTDPNKEYIKVERELTVEGGL